MSISLIRNIHVSSCEFNGLPLISQFMKLNMALKTARLRGMPRIITSYILVVLCIPLSSIWAVELVPTDKEKEAPKVSSVNAVNSQQKAELMVQGRENRQAEPAQLERVPYSIEPSQTGDRLDRIRFDDGYELKFAYAEDPSGKINAFTISGDKVSVSFRSGESVRRSLTGRYSLEDLLELLDQEIKPGPGKPKTRLDFKALRRDFEQFQEDREKAFRDYRSETDIYYEAIASAIGTPSLSRGEIDSQVERILAGSLQTPYAEKIRSIQPALYRAHVIPAGQKMNHALEQGVKSLISDLQSLLRFQGKTSVMQDGDSVEIIIVVR